MFDPVAETFNAEELCRHPQCIVLLSVEAVDAIPKEWSHFVAQVAKDVFERVAIFVDEAGTVKHRVCPSTREECSEVG